MPASAWRVDAALAGIVDAARQRADFVFDRFDRPARHRLGDGVANLGQFAAERGDRLLDPVGTLQRLDLAGDLEQMAFERGEIRARRLAGAIAGAVAGAVGGALRGGIGRGGGLSSSLWRAAISAIAKSSEAGLSGGEGR